jgi:hypothetical protein
VVIVEGDTMLKCIALKLEMGCRDALQPAIVTDVASTIG